MRKKASLLGILFAFAAICLVAGTFYAIDRAGFQNIYLQDLESVDFGWKYEIRTAQGETKKVIPQYIDEYSYTLSNESYDAVKESRIVTEYLQSAEIEMENMQCGIEVFLNDTLLYSDFQTTERDSAGYLLVRDADIPEEFRSVTINMPDEYQGSELTLITYFPENAEWRNPVTPNLLNENTLYAAATADTVKPMLWLVFLGGMTLVLAVFCMISMLHCHFSPKLIILFFVYAVSFSAYACQSVMGFYSGLQEQINRMLPMDVGTIEMLMLIICAITILVFEVWESRKRQRKFLLVQVLLFGLTGLFITTVQQSTELTRGITSYFPSIVNSVSFGHFVPLVKLVSSVIIYTITLLTVVQFVQWRLSEWQKKTRLLEHSRFARENYELVMQVDEDSRRRNHEVKHHMQTLYSLLMTQEADEAKSYIEKVIKEADQYMKMTYSENIVLSSIVGIRLNQAKKSGIDVQCHIHVPYELEADNVDLSVLLSNMLENAMEACMRMENRERAYIRLEIRKKQKFLFIECENSVDRKEITEDGQITIKDDRKSHGFGLDAMKAVAEKYASIIQMEREPDRITVRTNLCLPE